MITFLYTNKVSIKKNSSYAAAEVSNLRHYNNMKKVKIDISKEVSNKSYAPFVMTMGLRFTIQSQDTEFVRKKRSHKQKQKSWQPKTDGNGSGGNNGGKIPSSGGGNDDNYFNFNENGNHYDEEGWLRRVIPDNYS